MNLTPVAKQLAHLRRRGLPPRSPEAFAFAILCVAAATLLRLAIDFIAPDSGGFIPYFPAILGATLLGGRAAGAVATLLSALAAWYLFEDPRYVWFAFTPSQLASLILFFVVALAMTWITDQYREALRKLEAEQHHRQMIVDELTHRSRNKLATIHAILRHELRDEPAIHESISGRLRALFATDDFLIQPEAGVDLGQIVTMELQPYGERHVRLCGDPLKLPGRLSSAMALILHELATNAAKYGALSTENGCVELTWRERGGEVLVDWVESGGPPVVIPNQRGFGSKLIEWSLNVFSGSAQLEFAPTGLICRLRVPAVLPAASTPLNLPRPQPPIGPGA